MHVRSDSPLANQIHRWITDSRISYATLDNNGDSDPLCITMLDLDFAIVMHVGSELDPTCITMANQI